MSTTADYVEFFCEQIRGTGTLASKKMFGEYMVYVDSKPCFLLCDNTVYVKITPETSSLLSQAEKGVPYEGSKEHYILDIEDAPLCWAVADILREITPLPKPRKSKKVK